MENRNLGLKKEIALPNTTVLKAKPEPWTNDCKANLAAVLGRVCALQRQYGKGAAELQTLTEGFAWALRGYPVEKVIDAMGQFILQSPNIPTPFEIRQIIDPPPVQRVFDKSTYIRYIKLREEGGPYALTDEEEKYVKDYEAQSLRNAR